MFSPAAISSTLDLPLGRDICQRIHYAAMASNARTAEGPETPDNVRAGSWREAARLYGPSVYILPPEHIEAMFEGVTLRLYREIEELYCSRLRRSISTIARILEAAGREAHRPVIAYEAIWSICTYLEQKRAAVTGTSIDRRVGEWHMADATPEAMVECAPGENYRPHITYVWEPVETHILALRCGPSEDSAADAGLALYDAIVSQRLPSRDGAGGLIWQLPRKLTGPSHLIRPCEVACQRLGIAAEARVDAEDIVGTAAAVPTGRTRGRLPSPDQYLAQCDTLLYKTYGYSPDRIKKKREHEAGGLVGYRRDPARQFPELRELLPAFDSRIDADGSVEHRGLHYEDALLKYWIGQPVTVRHSQQSAALAWIYLDSAILCEARARELRRKDGTYRANLPRG